MVFENMPSGVLSGSVLAAVWAAIMAVIVFAVIAYVVFALAWMTIGKKLRYKYPWLAWIPFANISMILQMGGFGWAWVFLVLVPFVGALVLAVLMTIATWRIFEKRNYPGWLALTPLLMFIPLLGWVSWIAYIVILCIVAWRDNK